MTDRSFGKGLFLINLAILGAIAAILLYQVPQPWRGYLAAWLMFLGSFGLVLLKVLKHVYAYKSLKLTAKSSSHANNGGRTTSRKRGTSLFSSSKGKPGIAATGLKIVQADDVGRGRHTIN